MAEDGQLRLSLVTAFILTGMNRESFSSKKLMKKCQVNHTIFYLWAKNGVQADGTHARIDNETLKSLFEFGENAISFSWTRPFIMRLANSTCSSLRKNSILKHWRWIFIYVVGVFEDLRRFLFTPSMKYFAHNFIFFEWFCRP